MPRQDVAPREPTFPAPSLASSPPPKKPGPQLPKDWQARFLHAYRSRGGLHRAAEAASVHPETVRQERLRNPAFDQQVLAAREYYADLVEETMLASADRSDNPVGFIVRLKALRPTEYIERHAVMSVSLSAELPGHDAAELLRAMLGTLTDSSRTLLSSGPPALPPPGTDP
jgi:hypothetical protein